MPFHTFSTFLSCTSAARSLKLSPEAIVFYRDQMRRDMLRSFGEQDDATLHRTFNLLLETAGAKALGMEKMPETILSLGFQQ